MHGLSFPTKMLNSYHKPMETENDLQDVQPDEIEQEAEVEVENPEIAKLRKELEEKDKQIADLARAKRELKKEIKKPAPDSPKNFKNQSDEMDYGMKAYLRSEGIEPSEFEFVGDQLKQSGLKSVEDLLSNGYFQSQLKAKREAKAVEDATPSQTRGSIEPPSTRAEYWIAKGELPPNTPENRALRIEVVNKRVALEKSRSQFTDEPIVG